MMPTASQLVYDKHLNTPLKNMDRKDTDHVETLTVEDDKKKKDLSHVQLLYCGFISGLVQAGVFNPWDRALFLSVANSRPFLHPENFKSPWNGVFQTLFQRGISAGLYFPLEEIFTKHLFGAFKGEYPSIQPLIIVGAGLLAGTANGLLMNPISSIKYHFWAKTSVQKGNFISVATDMFQRGGFRPFLVGISATISRDVLFGGAFAYFRHELPPLYSSAVRSNSSSIGMNASDYIEQKSFFTDLAAGLIATTISSPLNYVRNIHYSCPPDVKADSTGKVLRDLWHSAMAEKTAFLKFSYLQSRLRLGWGTARVGCGMALASQFYSFIKTQI